jgi:hypothetical protein
MHGIHLYIRNGDAFKDIDLLGQSREISQDVIFNYRDNQLSESYWKKDSILLLRQDSLLKIYYASIGNPIVYPKPHTAISKVNIPPDQPLFLLAHQELDDLNVYNMDHLHQSAAEYKFDWELPAINTDNWLAEIMVYKRLLPSQVISNILYYGIIRIAKTEQ